MLKRLGMVTGMKPHGSISPVSKRAITQALIRHNAGILSDSERPGRFVLFTRNGSHLLPGFGGATTHRAALAILEKASK